MNNPEPLNHSRGAEWNKWDLHVHTPLSIEQYYGGNNEEIWEQYIQDLESLPPEIKVLGVNDYLFLDGYERLRDEKLNKNRLQNIELLFPVVEFRISKFAGVDFGGYKRINLHVIFSDELEANVIKSQFLNALQQSYTLEPNNADANWAGIITPQSLADLGAAIKESIPPEELPNYGSDLVEGFRNLNLDEAQIFRLLKENTYLRDKYIVAVGKTEWDSLKWTDASISTKKDIINKAQFVFVASESPEQFYAAKDKLKEQQVNDLLLDCSDAHYFSSSQEKDRIGNCNTWIKSDLTFKGLQQVLNEPDERVFVGELPDSIWRVRNNPTKVIDRVEVRKNSDSKIEEKWFDTCLPLNSGLVAIIGNKGSGKSALADIVGLLGNTKKYGSFSFLTRDKFCSNRGGKYKHFNASLTWHDETSDDVDTLDFQQNKDKQERVKYIPQSYLEEICSEVGLDENGAFYSELKDVIFSRIDESDRLGFDSLDSLLKHRDKEIENSIDQLISEIRALNREIIEVEQKVSKKHKLELKEALDEKQKELDAHRSDDVKPKVIQKPEEDEQSQLASQELSQKISETKRNLESIEEELKQEKSKDSELAKQEASAGKIIKQVENIQRYYDSSVEDVKEDFDILGLKESDLFELKLNKKAVADRLSSIQLERQKIREKIEDVSAESLTGKKMAFEKDIAKLTADLSAPQKRYQNYLSDLEKWNNREQQIIGDEKTIGSLEYIKSQIEKTTSEYPEKRKGLARRRMKKSLEIYREKSALRGHYSKYYGFVQKYLDSHPIANDQSFKISFDVSISEREFRTKFLQHISQSRTGNYYGADVGTERLNKTINRTNFNSVFSMSRFIKEIMHDLQNFDGKEQSINEQLKKGSSKEDLYNLIFSLEYLNPVYNLKWDEKELNQLSPGERGNLLLIFYLLLDQNDIPLVIDQPEENLDNQTVFKTLVPCIKDAKKRRQIVMVTHNPNLAVVCDAEQIIHANMNKDKFNEITYTTGSIEAPDMNKRIIDVLEGTRPAFDKRDAKYWNV